MFGDESLLNLKFSTWLKFCILFVSCFFLYLSKKKKKLYSKVAIFCEGAERCTFDTIVINFVISDTSHISVTKGIYAVNYYKECLN